jgi:hypothetical protein
MSDSAPMTEDDLTDEIRREFGDYRSDPSYQGLLTSAHGPDVVRLNGGQITWRERYAFGGGAGWFLDANLAITNLHELQAANAGN